MYKTASLLIILAILVGGCGVLTEPAHQMTVRPNPEAAAKLVLAIKASEGGGSAKVGKGDGQNRGGGDGSGGRANGGQGDAGQDNGGSGVPLSGKLNAPNATDPVLQDAYRNLWRPEDVRPGGTIGELLREKASGRPLEHLQKAKDRLTQLIRRVNDLDHPLSPDDRAGAERVINDLKDAIRIAEGP